MMREAEFGRRDAEVALRTDEDPMRWKRLQGVLWREHMANGALIWGFAGAWLIGQLVLMLFFHPALIVALGLVCGIYFGSAVAGGDARDGALEFSLGLPATRREMFLVRFVYAGSVLLSMAVVSALAIRYSLAQNVWALFVETGFTVPYEVVAPAWYAAAIIVPCASFCYAFGFAATASNRSAVGSAGTLGFLITLVVGMVGFAAEGYYFEFEQKGAIVLTLLAATALGVSLLAYRAHAMREGIDVPVRRGRSRGGSGGSSSARRTGMIMLLVFVFLVIFLALTLSYLSLAPSAVPAQLPE